MLELLVDLLFEGVYEGVIAILWHIAHTDVLDDITQTSKAINAKYLFR
jgi:hypothetical protein